MSYAYQWKRGGVNIAGATANTYTLVTADLGAMITATVTATNTAGSASATATAVGPVTAAASNTMQAQAGSFAFAGKSATLTPPVGGGALSLQAGAGSFALAGESMTTETVLAMPAGAGAVAFAGQSADLKPPVVGYTGPGDSAVQPGAAAWYGLRAYTAAKATALAPCITLVDTAGNNDITINLTAAGDINVAAITSWIAVNSSLRSVPKVKQIFDQVGSKHLTAVSNDVPTMPTLVMSGLGSHPVIHFDSATPQTVNSQGVPLGLSNPASLYAVARATAANSTAVVAGALGPLSLILWSGAGTVALFAGGFSADMAAADGTFWTMQGVINDTSSIGQINTTQVTGLTPGNAAMSGDPQLSNSSFPSKMDWLEAGFWAGNKSTTFNAVNTNAKAYWGY
jgi:hypothetical protein